MVKLFFLFIILELWMVEFVYVYDICRKMLNKLLNCLVFIECFVELYSCDM